jgi:hypothetical protein
VVDNQKAADKKKRQDQYNALAHDKQTEDDELERKAAEKAAL